MFVYMYMCEETYGPESGGYSNLFDDLFPRRREQPPYDNPKETPESLSDPVEMRRLNYQTPGMQCTCLQKC